jgi:SAM-dependent methyltransferase
VAAYNGPENVVISGYREPVEEICARFAVRGRRAERLRVSHGFHSPCMAPIEEEFERYAAGIAFQAPQLTVISTVTGKQGEPGEMSTGLYWRRQLRGSVHFDEAMQALAADSCRLFVEIGPGSTVLGMGRELIGRDGDVWVPSIRRATGEQRQMGESLAALWVRGAAVDWEAYYKGREGCRISLPTYPFERQRYWLETPSEPPIDPESSWNGIREAAVRQSGRARLDLDLASYTKRWELMDRLSSAYIRRTLADLGAFRDARECHSVESLQQACGIGDGYKKLLSRWLRRLAAEGTLFERDSTFAASNPLAGIHSSEVYRLEEEARAFFGRDNILLEYLISCGTQLTSVVTGRVNGLETLFPSGGFERSEAIYEHAPLSNYFSEVARAALEVIVRFSPRAGLRVLEIGAGTGATSSALLPVLAGTNSEYWFTDVSEIFLTHARGKFSEYSSVRYGLLNIECPEPEFEAFSAGVVIATNVLHATRDLEATLANVRKFLAPGGHLILCEATSYLPWFDVTTGLIEGWQMFEDPWRGDHPLLSPEQWRMAIEAAGFERVATVPETGALGEVLGQHVIVARVPGMCGQTPVVRLSADETRSSTAAGAPITDWAGKLATAPKSERLEILIGLAREALAATLRVPDPGAIDCRGRLIDLGLDSLLALELRNRIEKSLRLPQRLPATLVFDHPTIESVAEYLHRDVLGFEDLRAEKGNQSSGGILQQVEELTDEEAEALLRDRLRAFQATS